MELVPNVLIKKGYLVYRGYAQDECKGLALSWSSVNSKVVILVTCHEVGSMSDFGHEMIQTSSSLGNVGFLP